MMSKKSSGPETHCLIHPETTRKKKNVIMITLFLKRYTNETYWKRNQDAVYWIKLSRAQDQVLRFWQTTSFAIITYTTVPGDCIDRVLSQNGDRVIFERLATPRPAPKVTLKSNWQTAAAATTAAAAACSRGWRSEHLETACYLGKPSRSARWYETRHGSGASNQETGAIPTSEAEADTHLSPRWLQCFSKTILWDTLETHSRCVFFWKR